MKFVYDFINNVLPLIAVFILVGGLSALAGWRYGYDSGYHDGRQYGYNYRDLEISMERARIQAAEERKKQNVAKEGRGKGGNRSKTI